MKASCAEIILTSDTSNVMQTYSDPINGEIQAIYYNNKFCLKRVKTKDYYSIEI